MPINTKYLKKLTCLRYISLAKLNQYKICFAMIGRLLRFEEEKDMLKKVLTSTFE